MSIRDLITRVVDPEAYYAKLSSSGDTKLLTVDEVKSVRPIEYEQPSRLNRPQWSEWDTRAAIEEGFDVATWVYTCVHKLAMSIASIPWVAQESGGGDADEWNTVSNTPLHDLMQQPNGKQTMANMMYRLTAHLALGGNGVITKIRAMGAPVEMWPHNPADVKPVPNREEFISRYVLGSGANEERVDADDVIHVMLPDPNNIFWGMSPLKAGAKAVDIDVEAQVWQRATLANAGVPSGMVMLNQEMTKEQYKAAKHQLQESMAGSANARKVGLMTAGGTWLKMQMDSQELDFIDSRKLTREEICAIFQVPPPVVGIYENATLANIETAREIFWVDTIIPLLRIFRDGFNLGLAPEFGDGLRVNFDVSGVEALWRIFERRIDAALKLQKLGYSTNDINARLDLGMNDITGGAVGFIPSNMVPIDMMSADSMTGDM